MSTDHQTACASKGIFTDSNASIHFCNISRNSYSITIFCRFILIQNKCIFCGARGIPYMSVLSQSNTATLIDIVFNKGIMTDSDIATAICITTAIFNISIMANNDLIRSRNIRMGRIIRRTNHDTIICQCPYIPLIA